MRDDCGVSLVFTVTALRAGALVALLHCCLATQYQWK